MTQDGAPPLAAPRGVAPGGTIGIIGGGQLGRMLALAAARYGLRAHVFAPDGEGPAFDVAAQATRAAYDDETALAAFADAVDVATYEFENVPKRTAELVAARVPLHPSALALATAQDRLAEKRFVAGLSIPTAPFRPVDDKASLKAALVELGYPAILKTRRFGYDGKGQAVLRAGEGTSAEAAALLAVPCILEGLVPFAGELSVVAARGLDGAFAAYDPCANEHRDGVLAVTRVPVPGLHPATAARAVTVARRIADALDYVGVLAVELFLVRGPDGDDLVVNEIAPRVHNSGHWTIEGAETSQFAQHVRAVCGWPLGAAERIGGAGIAMENLIGDAASSWAHHLAMPGAHLHLYGKAEALPGRKMGHVTRLLPP